MADSIRTDALRTDSIRIDTGVKRVMINDDPKRVIEFNPKDVVFAEKFYRMVDDFRAMETDFVARANELEAVEEVDELGLPVNTAERLQLVREVCDWSKTKIDQIFGEGASEKAFGDAMNLEMFKQFFEGITPFIESARSEKVDKYRKVIADRKTIEDQKAVME